MTRDFTYRSYADLVETARTAGYDFLTVREYLARERLPDRYLILRHDVDRKPGNALDFARIEAERDVAATYYVRTVEKAFRPAVVERIEALGHEVGYHYEDLDRADGDVPEARTRFAQNLARLRQYADVDTVCMHGNPLTPHDNREMWRDPSDFDTFDLLGEAYLSMDFEEVVYFSDTGGTWRDGALKIKDHTMGEGDKGVQVDSTDELADLLWRRRVTRACLLSHPNRWAGSYPEFVAERAKDAAINAAKRGLYLLP